LRNALRYSPADDEITVSASKENENVLISVADHGKGVEKELLPLIFNAFVRDESGHGTGLGLAIASNAIHLHRGKIYAQNHSGGGLIVICSFPL
jgi:signal transduction histidine kinase